jgi:hypothetical protein
MRPRDRLHQLLLRAAEPAELLRTGFQKRCVQQALFLMLRNPTFEPSAIQVGMAAERAIPEMRRESFTVFLRAIHPDHATARVLMQNERTRGPLLTSTLDRGLTILGANNADTAFAGTMLHFMHTRKVPLEFQRYFDRLLTVLVEAKVIEPATWVSFLTAIPGRNFDKRIRQLLRRFAADCTSILPRLTPAQLQSITYAMSTFIDRYPGGDRPLTATLVAISQHAKEIPGKHLVACAYSAHVAGVASRDFLHRVIANITADVGTLTQWELLHLVVTYHEAMSPIDQSDKHWHALFLESAERSATVDFTVDVALLAKFADTLLPREFHAEGRRWCEKTMENLLALPPTQWRLREIGRLREVARVWPPSEGLKARVRAASATLPNFKVAERNALESL